MFLVLIIRTIHFDVFCSNLSSSSFENHYFFILGEKGIVKII